MNTKVNIHEVTPTFLDVLTDRLVEVAILVAELL
jgi:hypothetical protein